MTPARPMAASVVALGLAGTLTIPAPVFGAPLTCERPLHYAAQSAAELLRINRLDLGQPARPTNRPSGTAGGGTPSTAGNTTRTLPTRDTAGVAAGSGTAPSSGGAGVSGAGVSGAGGGRDSTAGRAGPGVDPNAGRAGDGRAHSKAGGQGGGGADPAGGGVGLGEARAVLIANGKVNSGGAARTLKGKIAGSRERSDLVLQQAPPVNPKAVSRRTGSKRFGAMKVGAGNLSARAIWAHGMACGKAAGDTSSASAEISRVTLTGGGSSSLVRVPEKIASRSGTAMRLRGGTPQSVASATITAGRISLVDNEVRIRVLRAPELRVSMTATGQSRVEYRPAIVEVSGRNGKRTRLSTPGEHIDVTLSEEVRVLETRPARLDPIGDLPLPKVSGLPVIGEIEHTPAPSDKPGSTLRIALGEVRQATRNNAIAARATAIRVTLTRNVDNSPGPGSAPGSSSGPGNGSGTSGGRSSSVVADLGIGMLEAAAVAPDGKISGRSGKPGEATSPAGAASQGNAVHGDASARNGAAGQSGDSAPGGTSGQGISGAGKALNNASLPITGPRVVSLVIAGSALIIAGVAAVALTYRRRKRT
jgi:hypothetical protein